ERPDRLEHTIATKAEAREVITQVLLARLRRALAAKAAQVHQRRILGRHLLELMLGEVSDLQIARFSTSARKRGELTSKHLHAGGFARAVPPQQSNAIAGREREADVLQDCASIVANR